jgi:hypothetical protein
MEQLANVLVAQVQWLYLKRSDMPDELLGYGRQPYLQDFIR